MEYVPKKFIVIDLDLDQIIEEEYQEEEEEEWRCEIARQSGDLDISEIPSSPS